MSKNKIFRSFLLALMVAGLGTLGVLAQPPAKDDKAVKKAPEKASPKTDGKAK